MELINWKRNINEGGGAFKFYGCHVLSLLAGIDKWDIDGIDSFCYNENDEYMFKLELQNLKGVKCIILKKGSDFDKIPKKGGCYCH